jgi:hypothetical protein
MNAAEFYDHFKASLRALNVSWGEMNQVEVFGKITMKDGHLEVTLTMPEKETAHDHVSPSHT